LPFLPAAELQQSSVVPEHVQPRAQSIRLTEATVRLAENLATRFGVTVQELIEALLLECAGESPSEAPSLPRVDGTARVIDLDQARQQRVRRR